MINTIKREILGAGQKKESNKLCLKKPTEIGAIPHLQKTIDRIYKDMQKNKEFKVLSELDIVYMIASKLLQYWESIPKDIRFNIKTAKKEWYYFSLPLVKNQKRLRNELLSNRKAI
jgi:hypothetical protein